MADKHVRFLDWLMTTGTEEYSRTNPLAKQTFVEWVARDRTAFLRSFASYYMAMREKFTGKKKSDLERDMLFERLVASSADAIWHTYVLSPARQDYRDKSHRIDMRWMTNALIDRETQRKATKKAKPGLLDRLLDRTSNRPKARRPATTTTKKRVQFL
jgi:hypothetical protein